jgi:RNA polymerase sigma-70 factor (ECF subfamily)
LLRRHYDRWWRLCRRLTGNDADAQDALQEGLILLARNIRRFDGRSAFTTWSYRVVSNACLDELRRRARRPRLAGWGPSGPGDGAEPATSTHFVADGGFAGAAAIDPRVEGLGDRMEVDAALARLPHEFRVAVVLRDLCDLDYAEIAQILDIPPGTVRSRIARGRGQLAEMLGNPATEPDRPTTSP